MMMSLGMFVFGLTTLAYQDMQRANAWRHPSQARVGAMPARQYVGPGDETISLKGVMSCGTSTATSVPCMFSHLGKEDFEARKNNYESLIDVLHHAGLAVLCIDN